MLADERLELSDELRMPTKCEIGVEAPLERRQVQLLESPDFRLRERLIGEIGERGTAPERERLAERVPTALLGEALEALEIELARLDPDQVPRRLGDDAVGTEQLAQLRDVVLEGIGGRLRRPVALEVVDPPVGRDDLVRAGEKDRQ